MSIKQIAESFSYFFDVGKDILFAGLDAATNTILCQIGNATSAVPDSDSCELWQTPGVWSLPAPPTQGKPSCQSLVLKHSDRDIIFATRDLRNSAIYGNLKSGETCVGASTGQARTIYKKDGSVNTVTTSDNTAGGQTMLNHFGPDGLNVITPWGGITINSQGITITAGSAALVLTSGGNATLSGTKVSVQGSIAALSGTVGTFLGPNATPNPVQGVAYSPVGPINVVSTSVFVSP
jgi:hypothetical protein